MFVWSIGCCEGTLRFDSRHSAATQLFGRMIKPDEVAAAALYLASDESHMITGTAFLIECGWTAG